MARESKPEAEKQAIEPIEGQIAVSLARAAELFAVTEKTIRAWAAEDGSLVLKAGRQGSNKDRTILDLVGLLKRFLEQDPLDAAKMRLALAQSDKHEMENELRRGELADVNDVARKWGEMVMACRAKLLSVPTKLAPALTNVADPAAIAEIIRAEVLAALEELASDEPRGRGSARGRARRDAAVSAAAETDGKRVGRRKAKTQ